MEQKKDAVFVICEYNPLHFGHEYQLALLKERYETVICIMSGDAVQRGEAAVYAKRARAEAAIRCGADAVFELPFPYSCMAAPDFAFAGVYVALSLCCKSLAFGAENDASFIFSAADVIADRVAIEEYRNENKKLSYPKAVGALMSQKLGATAAEDFKKPNNILGAEYIRAARALGAEMSFEIVRRNQDYQSSTSIRAYDNMLERIPKAAAEVLSRYPRRSMKNINSALLARARMLTPESDVYGLARGDVARLSDAAAKCGFYEDAVEAAISPTMTRSKARRGLLCALLGIVRSDSDTLPQYVRLLALNSRGAGYIAANKKFFALPVVSKPSHAAHLSEGAKGQYERALKAESVLALTEESGRVLRTAPKGGIMIF